MIRRLSVGLDFKCVTFFENRFHHAQQLLEVLNLDGPGPSLTWRITDEVSPKSFPRVSYLRSAKFGPFAIISLFFLFNFTGFLFQSRHGSRS